VRELENVLERAHTLCENQLIEASDLRLAKVIARSRGSPI
jgi:two-component system response regulator PilR (NtrC family)